MKTKQEFFFDREDKNFFVYHLEKYCDILNANVESRRHAQIS